MLQSTSPGLVNTWIKKLAYPLLLFGLLESLLVIVVDGFRLPDQLLPFTLIIAMSILLSQIRLVSGIYISNLPVGVFTVLWLIHRRFFLSWDLTELYWLKLLFQQLTVFVLNLWNRHFSFPGELTITLFMMPAVWLLVHLALRRLALKGKILVLILLCIIIQGLVFSYVDRKINTANVVNMLASLILVSLVRLEKLRNRWISKDMFGAEDMGIKWGLGAVLWIFLVISLARMLPAPGAELLVQDPRFQTVANLIGGTKPAQGSSEGATGGTEISVGTQAANNFKLQPEFLGGGWFGNNNLVMSVTSAQQAYWRGTSLDTYDGQKWLNQETKQQEKRISAGAPGYTGIKTKRLEQKIQLGAGFTSPVGFGAAMPTEVNGLQGSYVIDYNGTIKLSAPDINPGTIYTVISQVPVLDEGSIEVLRQSGNAYPADIKATYLSLPALPDRVRDLALRLTAEKANPYDKALALVEYFNTNQEFYYDLKPDPTPPGRDFVDYFLFDTKKGYCTYYSTAMAVMARCAGLPSRWVIGYTSGESNEKTPDVYRVSGMNKHAWVEIYFAGVGWVPFEPTKSFSLPATYTPPPPQKLPEVNKLPQVVPATQGPTYKLIIAAVAFGMAGLILVILRKKHAGRGQASLTSAINSRRSARRLTLTAYASFLRLMRKTGRIRRLNQTPREFAKAWENHLAGNMDYINRLTEVFEQVRYGQVNPSSQQVEQALADLEAIKQNLT